MSRKNVRAVVVDSGKSRVRGDYVEAMQGLRRSSATTPHRNRTRYNRTSKYRPNYGEDD